jgi:hypothetical protein
MEATVVLWYALHHFGTIKNGLNLQDWRNNLEIDKKR